MWTPWDDSQTIKILADGITFVTTAGHGGMKLSADRRESIAKRFPTFNTYVSRGGGSGANDSQLWFEEDCDVCLVIHCFPEVFPEDQVRRATRYVQSNVDYFGHEIVPELSA